MADKGLDLDVLRDLLGEASAIGQLAKSEESFTATYEAFQKGDREAFYAALQRLELIRFCGLICNWIRTKECVLVCLELCGPPKASERPPDPRVLAEAIVKITSD